MPLRRRQCFCGVTSFQHAIAKFFEQLFGERTQDCVVLCQQDQLLVYEDAQRNLALAVNRGSALGELGLSRDTELRLRPSRR